MRYWLAALAFLIAAASACSTQGLAFVRDDRFEFIAPDEAAHVRLPFEVRWRMSEAYDGHFAVFFDRAPMRPGQSLEALVPDGDPCLARPGCPDAEWLEHNAIFVTADRWVVVERLREVRTNNRTEDRHEVTVVYVDGNSRRVGEAAFIREFIVERED